MSMQSLTLRWQKPEHLFFLVLCACCVGLPEVSRDPFVVKLALEEASIRVVDSPDEEAVYKNDSPVPEGNVVNMSIQGYPFKCRLPAPSARTHQRQMLNLRHLVATRAAALAGEHFFDISAEGYQGVLELCVGDHVTIDGVTAIRILDSDKLLEEGGFERFYAGAAAVGSQSRVRLRCQCQMPSVLYNREPPCRPGDVVQVPRQGQTMTPAVVARLLDENEMRVFWQSPPWPGVPWLHDARQMELERTVPRLEAVSADGRSCAQAEPVYQTAISAVYLDGVMGRNGDPIDTDQGVDLDIESNRGCNVTLAAVTCCGIRALRAKPEEHEEYEGPSSEVEYQRLMAPLVGRCMRFLIGWWTYEICWPWRVRQLHLSMTGEVEDFGTVLGHFNKSLVRQRAVPRQEGQSAFELVTLLEGDTCEQTVQRWKIMVGFDSYPGVGGSFNPARLLSAEGRLTFDHDNQDGCKPFGDGRLDGAVVLVRRGGCWFHTKALHAQAAGAVAVIVFNAQHYMVDLMEGVDELQSPGIPTVLVEDAAEQSMFKAVDSHVQLKKSSVDGMELERPISTSVTFRCSATWLDHHEICNQGDVIAVKLPPKNMSSAGTRWPKPSVRVLQATIDEILRDEGNLAVTWQPSEQEVDDSEELPDVIPMSIGYHEGVPCDSKGGARIEEVADVQACSAEFTVHVPELCAHPRLAPPRPQDTQVINCIAEEAAREALAKRPRKDAEEDARQTASQDAELGSRQAASQEEDGGNGEEDPNALTPESILAIHSRLDTDHDGWVSKSEFWSLAESLSITELKFLKSEPLFLNADSNNDDSLNLEEFLQYDTSLQHITSAKSYDKFPVEEIHSFQSAKFYAADQNADGVVDVLEAHSVHYPTLNQKLHNVIFGTLLRAMDLNSDGQLTATEFSHSNVDHKQALEQIARGVRKIMITEDQEAEFDLLDKDHDRVLTADEFKAWSTGLFYIEKAMKKLFDAADMDNNAMLTAEEFQKSRKAFVSSDIHEHLKEWAAKREEEL